MTKNQFITEALGECWHDPNLLDGRCKKCGKISPTALFDTPEGFFWLWDKMQKYERWEEFLISENELDGGDISYTFGRLIHPFRFMGVVAEFFGWKEK
jgi:hypothetical protein